MSMTSSMKFARTDYLNQYSPSAKYAVNNYLSSSKVFPQQNFNTMYSSGKPKKIKM